MVAINPTISIIVWNDRVDKNIPINIPIKYTNKKTKWIKNKTQLYIVYKKPTLNIETQVKSKVVEKGLPN